MARPALQPSLSVEEFDSYYWYHQELLQFARELGISTSGSKFDLHDRIGHYLRTGQKLSAPTTRSTADFDWRHAPLTLETVITDNYRNTQNVRGFFEEHLGPKFKFSLDSMHFMRTHIGSTLGNAVDYLQAREQARREGYRQAIPEGNQYNLYLRTYLEHHPEHTKAQATEAWLRKINRPRPGCRGRGFVYSADDLAQ